LGNARVIAFTEVVDLSTTTRRAFWFGVRPDTLADLDPSYEYWQPQELPPRVGTENHLRMKVFGVPLKVVSRFDEFDPPHRFVVDGVRPPPARWSRITATFEDLPNGATRFTYSMEIRYPLLGALIARIIASVIRRGIRTSVRRTTEIYRGAGRGTS
jgi:ligand-binding SRPBCC domain-containing protein